MRLAGGAAVLDLSSSDSPACWQSVAVPASGQQRQLRTSGNSVARQVLPDFRMGLTSLLPLCPPRGWQRGGASGTGAEGTPLHPVKWATSTPPPGERGHGSGPQCAGSSASLDSSRPQGSSFKGPLQRPTLDRPSPELIPLEEKQRHGGWRMRQIPQRNCPSYPDPLLCGHQLGRRSPWGPEDGWQAPGLHGRAVGPGQCWGRLWAVLGGTANCPPRGGGVPGVRTPTGSIIPKGHCASLPATGEWAGQEMPPDARSQRGTQSRLHAC